MRDVVIIGAGVAGLMAATYFGRYRRPALVVDGDSSRARWIPESHNIPGFPAGVGGIELLSRLRCQAEQYGAEVVPGWVQSITRRGQGFAIELNGTTVESRFVVLATGIEDKLPPLAGTTDALTRSVLRVCPICDAFEAVDKAIAVIGDGDHGEREAQFLRTYSDRICYLHLGRDGNDARGQRLSKSGIECIEVDLAQLTVRDEALDVALPDGTKRRFEVFYVALGCSPRMELAAALGALCDENNALRVDSHQQTTIDRLYAAGDIVRGLNQVVVAGAEAAIAATAIHNRLRASAPGATR